MLKIKLLFDAVDRKLQMQVLEMPEEMRGNYANKELAVYSRNRPQLERRSDGEIIRVYLAGSNISRDSDIVYCSATKEEAIMIANRLRSIGATLITNIDTILIERRGEFLC